MKKYLLPAAISCSVLLSMASSTLAIAQSKDDCKSYLVATAHFDTQWNWDVQESIGDHLHRTMVQNFWLFEHYPEYVFNFESAQKYSWMKEYYPQEYAKVVEYVKAGRWNVCGSAWEATDPNGHLQMCTMRMITNPALGRGRHAYYANTKSDTYPEGYSQEETIKSIWNE